MVRRGGIMRKTFDEKLENLSQHLIEMGTLIERAINFTKDAFVMQDAAIADEAIKCEQEIDYLEKEIERMCLDILLLHQPVARDLRIVSSALKMITDMERIGDQCSDISEITKLLVGETYIHTLEHIPKMADATSKMVTDAVDAYVKKDVKLARKVMKFDDEVDRLFLATKKDLIDTIQDDPDTISQALDLMMVAKYYERIGDHAENIAEWVVFSLKGNSAKSSR